MAKDVSQKINNAFTNTKMSFEPRKRTELLCYINVLCMCVCAIECWKISSQLKRRLEIAKMLLSRKMTNIQWTACELRQSFKKNESKRG